MTIFNSCVKLPESSKQIQIPFRCLTIIYTNSFDEHNDEQTLNFGAPGNHMLNQTNVHLWVHQGSRFQNILHCYPGQKKVCNCVCWLILANLSIDVLCLLVYISQSKYRCVNAILHARNSSISKAMSLSTMFHGTAHYFYGHFPELYGNTRGYIMICSKGTTFSVSTAVAIYEFQPGL